MCQKGINPIENTNIINTNVNSINIKTVIYTTTSVKAI